MFLPAQGPTGGERRTVLAARGVSHVYGSGATTVRALDDVSLTLERGEMVALSGPSGSGKSTFMSLVCGLEQLQHGEVDVCGTSLGTLTDAQLHTLRRGSVGMIFQGYNLLASLTAAENVALPLELAGTPARAAAATAEQWLGDVGLDGLGDRYPDQLSGGQQQRVAIARALVTGARLVLADEPTGALDSTSGALVISTLRDQARRRGAAVLVVTHDATVAAACDRHLQLRDGRLQDPLATPAVGAS